ncbi:hypothetical protein ABZ951_02340 [Streptomyces sp. NPDC046215]|uniref:TetR family transcriptional regulator n=1 Tax=Streptomyces stramineus TaxID=173861 RepID=A0ABP3J7Z4_9ACTN
MEDTPLPEPLRHAVHQLVAESVLHCSDALRYTAPDLVRDGKRMALHRATDAADTLDTASMLIAAYMEREGAGRDTLQRYLQPRRQQDRTAGPQAAEHAYLDGVLGRPAPEDARHHMGFLTGQYHAQVAQDPEEEPEQLWAQACLHGLKARLCGDRTSLESLPPRLRAMARRVADALEEPQPATV